MTNPQHSNDKGASETGLCFPDDTIVFDIGGTWFRSGIVTSEGELVNMSRQTAINYRNTIGLPPQQLQKALVDFLVREADRLSGSWPKTLRSVSISVGAALNAHTGVILNSGPLWGPDCPTFDLLVALRERDANLDWYLVNDITAALLRNAYLDVNSAVHKLSLVTVSTGVGMRTFDAKEARVPVERMHGLQGEIGHIPINFKFRERLITMMCDCGGRNHLNAFCSGVGITNLLPHLAETYQRDFRLSRLSDAGGDPREVTFPRLIDAVRQGDGFAESVLDAVTLPLAKILIHLFTLDPEVERVVLTGGIVHSLKGNYLESLIKNLSDIGLYQISDRDPDYFIHRVRLGAGDDTSGLIGAAIAKNFFAPDTEPVPSAGRWPVHSSLPIKYKILETPNLFGPAGGRDACRAEFRRMVARRSLVFIDKKVMRLHGANVSRCLEEIGAEYSIATFGRNEASKNMSAVSEVLNKLIEFGIDRCNEPLIVIGGGVLLDIVGFAASMYRRGIPYIRVPTTLLAMVDAAVGVKTGVNYRGHKNRVGTYHPPVATLIDWAFLSSLEPRQLRNGLAEIIKVGVIKDPVLFDLVEAAGAHLVESKFQGTDTSSRVIRLSIGNMVSELEPNLWEFRKERLMDFGHTFSPVIEMKARPHLLHGEAVAVDIALSTALAAQRSILSQGDANRILGLLKRLRLPISHPACSGSVLAEALADARRHRAGLQRIPLPVGIGSANFYNDVSLGEVKAAAAALSQL